MKNISDDLLIETYVKSLDLGLSKEFITLLREEIKIRNVGI